MGGWAALMQESVPSISPTLLVGVCQRCGGAALVRGAVSGNESEPSATKTIGITIMKRAAQAFMSVR
jgi:hypothetical protein